MGLQYTESPVSNRTMMFNVSLKSSFVAGSDLLVAKPKQFHVKNVICSYRELLHITDFPSTSAE